MTNQPDEPMNGELLPCPFCGAKLSRSAAFSTRSADCFLHPPADDGDGFCVVYDVRTYSNSPKRIAAWNRRAPVPSGW